MSRCPLPFSRMCSKKSSNSRFEETTPKNPHQTFVGFCALVFLPTWQVPAWQAGSWHFKAGIPGKKVYIQEITDRQSFLFEKLLFILHEITTSPKKTYLR